MLIVCNGVFELRGGVVGKEKYSVKGGRVRVV